MRRKENGGRDLIVISKGEWEVKRGVRLSNKNEDWMMIRKWNEGMKDLGNVKMLNIK